MVFFWKCLFQQCVLSRVCVRDLGIISHLFHVKVVSDSGVDLVRLCRAHLLLHPLLISTLQTTATQLESHTWMDKSKECVAPQAESSGRSVQHWRRKNTPSKLASSENENVRVDAVWKASRVRSNAPEKLTHVKNEAVSVQCLVQRWIRNHASVHRHRSRQPLKSRQPVFLCAPVLTDT